MSDGDLLVILFQAWLILVAIAAVGIGALLWPRKAGTHNGSSPRKTGGPNEK